MFNFYKTKPLLVQGLKNHRAVLIMLSVVFFALYSSIYTVEHNTFNSPDETANHYFALRLADGQSLKAEVSPSGVSSQLVSPRSMRVEDGKLVPASFFGLILLYGSFAFIFSNFSLYVLPALTSVLGVWGFYFLIKYIWWERLAFTSAVMLFLLPSWWYYSAFGFFPNVLFLTLVIWSLAALILYSEKNKIVYLVLSAVLIGLALITRLSALPWIIIPFLVIGFNYYKKHQNTKPYIIFGLTLAIPAVILLIIQNILYGSSLETGYIIATESNVFGFIQKIFPQGINIKFAFGQFQSYFLKMFWFISIPMAAGVIALFKRSHKVSKGQKLYALIYGLVSLWLLIYYGSWQISDNITKEITIGVSYVRYWLPITVFAIPLVAYAVHVLINYFRFNRTLTISFMAFLFVFYAVITTNMVYYKYNDSILNVKNTLAENLEKKRFVINRTEEDAVIVSNRQDKVFFPERRVVHIEEDSINVSNISKVASTAPVYIYTNISGKNYNTFAVDLLKKEKLSLTLIDTYGNEKLYEVTPMMIIK
jgi:hypothetical protein